MSKPRILTLDIETSPNIAHVWGLFKQTVSLSQLMESTRVIAFAAKWHGEKRTMFYSDFHHSHAEMVQAAWDLLNEADIIITYNGKSFDVPHLNREFGTSGLGPPSPYQHIDLYLTVRSVFRFPSNKLQHASTEFGLEGKLSTGGHELWVKCLAGDPNAWGRMRLYNKRDVVLTEQFYDKLKPWIRAHPNLRLFKEGDWVCPRCTSENLAKDGFKYTQVGKYQAYRCKDCGGYSQDSRSVLHTSTRAVS